MSTAYDKRPMRAIVTGGAGFIGSHLVDALVERGDEVHAVDNLATGSRENLRTDFELHELDVRDEAMGEPFARLRPEAVFHLAAQDDVGTSVGWRAEMTLASGLARTWQWVCA